jgi:two-component system, cell cycle sensor histidine kinase and response regulator CckA
LEHSGRERRPRRAASVVAGGILLARADDVLASSLGGEETVARLARVVRTGQAELIEAGAQMCVPLLGPDGPIGAMTLGDGERAYGTAELRLAHELARRAAAAVDQVRLHRSLERSEERYRLLFEQNPMAMWVYDVETLAFLAVNEAAVRRYGYSREEFLAMTIADIRPPEEIPALVADIRQGAGSPTPRVWRHRRKDGSLLDVEITAGRIVFQGRDAALVMANDVSERRRLEDRLSEAEKMEAIGRLAGGVAHDFNNLLTVISGYASLLLAREEHRSEELATIAHAAEHASVLTRQLLAFSRRQVMNPTVLDLNRIIATMQPMLHRIIGDDVAVGVQLEDGLAPVQADRAQLERVILNLAANARDAMPDGGQLTLETANVELDAARGEGSPGAHVLLAVSDNGVGMSPEVRRRLFEPFFTTKAPGAGTGLGLATVFGVVKQTGGSIYVYSEEGSGTTIKIYLPAAPRGSVAEPAPEPAAATASGSETIMVVEDDESVRELVRIMLEANGYRVHGVGDPVEAERVAREIESGLDLLLTDVVMPHVSGQELAARLAALRPGLRVLFMSGYSDRAVYRHGVLEPGTAFIEKPFTERTLTRRVREVLDS